jgi:transcriptional antiterminator NusG
MNEKKWLVFYTKSRQEKKVRDQLAKNGFEVFLPLQKVMRQWSDRKQKVEVPLFNSYIFVRESEDKIVDILQSPGIAWNIRHNNKPAVLHPKEVDLINQFLSSGLLIEVNTVQDFQIGDNVQIVDGPLKGVRGQLIRTASGDRFSLAFESMASIIQVEISALVLKTM